MDKGEHVSGRNLARFTGQTTPEPLGRLCGYARLAARLVLFLPPFPLLEKTLMKSGIMWFQDSAFKIPVGQLKHFMAKLA